jgi:radical SAM protein with 4Fe4S-binding SPASM domain
MIYGNLQKKIIYVVPAGKYFGKSDDACYLVFSPLANVFFLSLPREVEKLEQLLETGESNDTLDKLLNQNTPPKDDIIESYDTACTLHLLLNEKCNFRCKYCYSAEGRSSAELSIEQISTMLNYFLSSERSAVKERTVMFMGGGEPVLSWDKLEQSTLLAKEIASKNNVNVYFSLTTNGSVLNDRMIAFLKEYDFMVQISFEVLPDVQDDQRGMNEVVAQNLKRLLKANISNYVRSTITTSNVDRIPEMVEYCQTHFPEVSKLSCQHVVDPDYFTNTEVVDRFFDRYFKSFTLATEQAKKTNLQIHSSSSHLVNYSMRQKFCKNIVCLTPHGTLTTCPDVSSPKEKDYNKSVFAKIENNEIIFNNDAFKRLTNGSIHSIEKCQTCWAKWNCGSGCPSSRRVYSDEIFDSICNFYRRMLCHELMSELAMKFKTATGKEFYAEIASKL